jgi:tRNA pseudouridine38-40 synthase
MTALRGAGFDRNPVSSSRTDLGVHARMQVLSLRVFDATPPEEVAGKVNALLPPGVGLVCSRRAAAGFNAAWLSTGKHYRYRFLAADRPEWAPFAWRVEREVDFGKVNELLGRFVGTRDFAAFHDKGSSVKLRTIRSAQVVELGGGLFEARIEGDAFGRYMIRYLVGAIVDVLAGKIPLELLLAGLEEARPFVRGRAPAPALTLWEVEYPKAIDPFSAADRASAPLLPEGPPFTLGLSKGQRIFVE